MPFPITAILEVGAKLIDRLIPDPLAKAQAQLELVKLQQTGELAVLAAETDLARGQLETNKIEAASTNPWVGGWRPAIGWLCGVILAVNYLVVPLLAWLSPVIDMPAPDRLDMSELWPVLLGMLGLSVTRSYDKKAGTS